MKKDQVKSNQRNFLTYQQYLEQTKDIFNNKNVKIDTISNFRKKFSSASGSAFKFTKYRLIAFFLDFFITLAIVISLLATGITCSN